MAEMILKATGSKLQIISAIHVTSTQAQYDTCLFEFDEAWDGYGVRTAVFYSNPNNIKAMLLDGDNKCYIPWDSFGNSRYLYIGVYGNNGESYLPTQFVEVMYQPGANVDDHLYPPTPGIYEQIAAGLSEIMVSMGEKASQADLDNLVQSVAEKASASTVTALEAQVLQKADSATVTAIQSQVTGLASGSPAGTYADLAALNTANPDHSKIYITLDDGNWRYWNGSAWVAGGVYQATERPLDTTLSVSGMAADAKATGDKVGELKSAIELNQYDYWSLDSSMIESGYYDDNGTKQPHALRWRTKDKIHVNAGDVLRSNRLVSGLTFDPAFKVEVYDATGVHTSTVAWFNFATKYNIITFAADGYFALSMQMLSTATSKTDYDGYITLVRYNTNAMEAARYANLYDVAKSPIGVKSIGYGYWYTENGEIFIVQSAHRAAVTYPIPVKKGDEIHPTNKNVLFDAGDSTLDFSGYSNSPFKCTVDGYAYINFKNSAGTDVTLSDFDNAITIKRACNIASVETVTANSVTNGYYDGSYVIQSANHRAVSFDGIRAYKGDHVRINSDTIGGYPHEFANDGSYITKASNYHVKNNNNDFITGDYVVKNDCWIKCQMLNYLAPATDITPNDCAGAFSVIHTSDTDLQTAHGKHRFPKSCKKPRVINVDSYKEMQDGTVINGKLWISCDDYANTICFKIINITTGALEKTITHDLGHAPSIDYNENNDTLLIAGDQCIYLYASPTGEETSITEEDCTQIEISAVDAVVGSACWGEDDQTVYVATGYDSTFQATLNVIKKLVLAKSSETYTGAYTVANYYSLTVVYGTDTIVLRNSVNYSQGIAYDGYLYLGYGTNGFNCLVIDLDDDAHTAAVVGNYKYHWYAENRTELSIEPQTVALNGSKIILGGRDWYTSKSLLMEFDR